MKLRTLIASFAALAGITTAQAKNYQTVWSQDFEDEATMGAEITFDCLTNVRFGTTAGEGTIPGTPTQAERNLVPTSSTSKFYSIPSEANSGNLLFTLPSKAVTAMQEAQDYVVEFDYYQNFITSSTYSGLAIQGANGPIATFYATAGSKSGESTGCKVYLGDLTDEVICDQVKGYERGADPSSSNCDKYWLHITVKGVASDSDPAKNGLYLTIESLNQATPATVMATTRVGDFDVVTHLFERFDTRNAYQKYLSLDDVAVKTAFKGTYTWTGALGDNAWTTPGNWDLNGVASTEFYPQEGDAAVVSLADQMITVSVDVGVESLSSAGGLTLNGVADLNVAGNLSVNGKFTKTGNGDVTVGGDATVESFDLGGGQVSVAGRQTISSGTVKMTDFAITQDSVKAHPMFSDKLIVANDLELTSLTGGGTLESDADLKVTTPGSSTQIFYGTLAGAMSVTKAGSATLRLYGINTFTGDLNIEAGTVQLVSPLQNAGTVRYNADMSAAAGITLGEDGESIERISTGGNALIPSSAETPRAKLISDSDYFGGRSAADLTGARYVPDGSKIYANSIFVVYQKNELPTADQMLHRYNDNYKDYIQLTTSGVWNPCQNNGSLAWACMVDGSYSTKFTPGKASVLNVNAQVVTGGNRNDAFGHLTSGYDGRVAQIFGVAGQLSVEKSRAVQGYLMNKWGIAEAAENQILPATVNLKMSTGTVLDLGGMTQKIASLSGAGTIQNGRLDLTEKTIVVKGDLTMPAMAGVSYDLQGVGNLTLVGEDVGEIEVTIEEGLYDPERSEFTLSYAGPLNVKAPADVTVAHEEGSTTWTVTIAERGSATFVWQGVDSDWNNAANWQSDTATGKPTAIDTVVFPDAESAWIVDCAGEKMSVSNIVANGAVALANGSVELFALEGNAIVEMADGFGFYAADTGDAGENLFLAPIKVSSNTAFINVGRQYAKIRLRSALSGAGTLTVGRENSDYTNCEISIGGDNASFEGTLVVPNDNIDRNYVWFETGKAISRKAKYDITCGFERTNAGRNVINGSTVDRSFHFGELTGFYRRDIASNYQTVNDLYVGYLNTDFVLRGTFAPSGSEARHENIHKVGTGTMTFDGVRPGRLYMEGGVLAITNDQNATSYGYTFAGGELAFGPDVTIDPSATIVSSAAPIAFDDGGTSRTWSGEISSSNVGGLVKKGAGTLTLAAVPAYTGVTTVEAGELVVPAETRIHWDVLSAGTLTGVQPTSYDYQIGTTNIYDSAAAVPSAGDNTLNLDNLLAIDLTSVTMVERNSKFVIAEAKAFNVGGEAITKAGREKIALIWGKDTVFPEGKTAADYTLQVVNGQLVVANKAVGIVIIIK